MKPTRFLIVLATAALSAASRAEVVPVKPNIVFIISDDKPELYDLRKDSWEKNDLAEAEPGRVKDLSAKINQWWKPETEKAAK